MMNQTAAGIVLYNPSIERLKENLDSITAQADTVVLVDNGSSNTEKIKMLAEAYRNVEIIYNHANLGIAKALNQIVVFAEQKGAEWVLTLDQDSVCGKNLIDEYNRFTALQNVASMTCEIKDRNFQYANEPDSSESYIFVKSCISSGNYIKISVWKAINGFDETFFIDKVDTDYCFRLINKGYKIIKIPYQGLLHEVGTHTKRYKVLGKKFTVFNHSPFRCYYIIRNQIYFARKHEEILGKKSAKMYRRTAWTRVFIYVFFEKDKINKLKSWYRGIKDGYKMKLE